MAPTSTYDVSAPSSCPTSPPPSYAVSSQATPNNRPLDFKHDEVSSPTGNIQVARYSQTLNTFHPIAPEDDLPEVVIPDDKASEGLIPVESSPAPSPILETVTPLNLLGEQPDTVDCPFCCRRVVTRIKKDASYVTHITATTLFLTTLAGAVAPYAKHWNSNITHICTNCDRKVAYKAYGKKMVALGTPEHLKVASKFPAAASKEAL